MNRRFTWGFTTDLQKNIFFDNDFFFILCVPYFASFKTLTYFSDKKLVFSRNSRVMDAFMTSTFSLSIKWGEKVLCSKQDFLSKRQNCFVVSRHQRNTFHKKRGRKVIKSLIRLSKKLGSSKKVQLLKFDIETLIFKLEIEKFWSKLYRKTYFWKVSKLIFKPILKLDFNEHSTKKRRMTIFRPYIKKDTWTR